MVSRISSAWAVLTGKAAPADAASGAGFLSRVVPYGQPPRRGTRELLRAYETHPWFRAVAGRIAGELSSVPWALYRGTGEAKQRIERHPFLEVMGKPNPLMSGAQIIALTQVWLDAKGEGFWLKERNARGQVVELWPVPPHWIASTPTSDAPWFTGSFGQWQAKIPAEEVVWIRELSPENPYARGVGIGEALADELDTDEYAARHVKAYFYNHASPEVMVSMPGAEKGAIPAMREAWLAQHQGFWNKFRAFFTSSDIKVERLDTTFRDMQLMELRGKLRDTFISVFGVPPEVVGVLQNSNRSTIDSAYYLFAKGVLVPRLTRWSEVLNDLLVSDFAGAGLVYEFENPVPEDKAFALQAAQARPSAFTDNEIRRLAGQQPAEGKDEFPQPMTVGVAPVTMGDEPEFVKGLPPRRKAPADGGSGPMPAGYVPLILDALKAERLTVETDPVFDAYVREWSANVLRDLGAMARFDVLNPLVSGFLRDQSATRIKGLVDETTRATLRAQLEEAVRAGESIRDAAKRVRTVFTDATEARAEMIARTEVVRSSNWATTEAQRVSQLVERRAWVSTRDGRARESHLALDGVEIGINDRFRIGGATADHPGGFGVPSEDIACRCTTVAVIADPADGKALDPEKLGAVWKAYDSALRPWEAETERALRRGFRAQEDDLLAVIDTLARNA